MLEDDDKLRRNLVLTSAVVLIYFWLDIPEAVIASKVFGVEAGISLTPWKWWSAVLTVLLYQMHRYLGGLYTGPDAQEFLGGQYIPGKQRMVEEALRKCESRFSAPFIGEVKHVERQPFQPERLAGLRNYGRDATWMNGVFEHVHFRTAANPFEGVVTGPATKRDPEQPEIPLIAVAYRFSSLRRCEIELRALLPIVRSKHLTALVVPVLLGYVAILATTFRLASVI